MASDPTTWVQLYLYPILVTLILWVGLTIGLVWLNRKGPQRARWTLILLLPALVLIHQQLVEVHHDLSIWGCYQAFIGGMLIWAWHELAFYSGVLTGPWREPCPTGATSWQRFGCAMGTHLYHEVAVLVELLLLLRLHADAINFIGPLTFGLLWLLQHSAKLNVFLGTRHLEVDLFPAHLRYLGSYWRKRQHNPFFPFAVGILGVLAWAFWQHAGTLSSAEGAVGVMLLAGLATLGLLEHLLLMLPPPGRWLSRQPRTSTLHPSQVRVPPVDTRT